MENENNKGNASDAKKHLRCYVRKVEPIEGEYPRIDISVDVEPSDTKNKEVAEQLHLGFAEVSQ